MLKAIADAAPDWITAAELGEQTALSSARMGKEGLVTRCGGLPPYVWR